MKLGYTGLHQHTSMSLLDAIANPNELIEKCKELGYKAVTATEHGNCYGLIKMYKKCQEVGIPFIPACELYMTPDHKLGERKSYHLTVLCENNKGLENLFRILTHANTPVGVTPEAGFYYKPRTSWNELVKYNEGLIILSGCMASIMNREFIANGYNAGKDWAKKFLDVFGRDRYFIEIQDINDEKAGKIYIPEQKQLKEMGRKLAKELKIEPVATADCVPGNTLISIKNGCRQIENLEKGDLVWTKEGQLRPIKKIWIEGTTDTLIEIRGLIGSQKLSLSTTPNHRILINKKGEKHWVKASELKAGYKLCIPKFKPDASRQDFTLKINNITVNKNMCRVLGTFFHEYADYIKIKDDSPIRQKLVDALQSVGIKFKTKKSGRQIKFYIENQQFVEFLDNCREQFPHNFTKNEILEVLDFCLKSCEDPFYTEILKSYYYASNNSKLVYKIEQALNIAGVYVGASQFKSYTNKQLDKFEWCYKINLIGLNHHKFEAAMGRTYEPGNYKPKFSEDEKFFYVPIKTINVVNLNSPIEVWDMEVDQDHSFVANGYTIHNSHWVEPYTDVFVHEVWKAIESKNTLQTPVANPDKGTRGRMVYNGIDYHLRSESEMLERFTVQEVENSGKIAERCKVDIPLKQQHMPKFDENLSDEDAFDLLKEKLREGWKKRGITKDNPKFDQYKERIKTELGDIKDAKLQNYFLIVADACDFCYKNNIPVGFGRGSAAGALVSYLLHITHIDPLEYNLIWERFYNAGRKGSMPDIDLDICVKRRDEVIKYLRQKFGEDRVYQMMTVSTLASKAAVKDVGKVLGLPFEYTNSLVKNIKDVHGKNLKLAKAIKDDKVLKRAAEDGEDWQTDEWQKELDDLKKDKVAGDDVDVEIAELEDKITERKKALKKTFEVAQRLEGSAKARSTHACALLIADEDIRGKVPLCWDAQNKTQLTALDMYDLEDMGYLKLDILGLKNLSVCTDIHPDGPFAVTDLEDPLVYDMLGEGKTKGIFQLESKLATDWAKKLKPTNIREWSDLIALIRPATLDTGLTQQYLENRQTGSWTYLHEDLKPILDKTYGVCIYQESLLEIVKKFAGFSLKDCDSVRRACGKKKPEEMKLWEEKFIKGCLNNNYNEILAKELWRWILASASYSFNLSHSIAYAHMGYVTAWFKVHKTEKFFLALLRFANNKQKEMEEISELYFDAKSFGINIVPPEIALCNKGFEIAGPNRIAFGFQNIRGIGVKSLAKIKKLKGKSWDFFIKNAKKHKIAKDEAEALILSGALDSMGMTRKNMLDQWTFYSIIEGKKDEGVFRHIMTGAEHIKVMPKSDDKVLSLHKATSFIDGIQILKDFLENENITEKFISSNRAATLKSICHNYLEEYQEGDELSIKEKAGFEQHYLGIPATCSCVDAYQDARKTHNLLEADSEDDNVFMCIVALVSKIKLHIDKNKRQMAFLDLVDGSYKGSAVLFAKQFEKHSAKIKEGRVLLFKGKKNQGSIMIQSIELI